nr:MAG TPA: hypothetical protein [Caudoviricetes sp.]
MQIYNKKIKNPRKSTKIIYNKYNTLTTNVFQQLL